MAAKYEIQFENKTNSAYYFGVYQEYPRSTGLNSVVWQLRGLPPRSTNKATWSTHYGVAIADWDENGDDYSGLQIIDAQPGNIYHVEVDCGDIPVINPLPTSVEGVPVASDQIKLCNRTRRDVKLGFAINGCLVALTDSCKAQWAHFTAHFAFWVAIYRDIKLGNPPGTSIVVGPEKVVFSNENTKALVQCQTENGREILKEVPEVSKRKESFPVLQSRKRLRLELLGDQRNAFQFTDNSH